MIKKIFTFGLLSIVLFCCACIRSVDGVLESIFIDNNITYAYYITEDGNVWIAGYNTALEIGEHCNILFYNNLTFNNIYDDVIITLI